jgi:uncharacterized membrane protein affecting hemolysin expression
MEVCADRERLEKLHFSERLEDLAEQLITQVDFSLGSIVETDPENIVVEMAGFDES